MSLRSPFAATALLGLLLAAVAAPSAGARVIASSVSGFTGGPALAADGRVVVGERRGDGALRILAIDPATGAQTEVTAFGALTDPEIFPMLGVSGTGGIVTASHRTQRREGIPNALSSRIVTVLPAVAELGSCPEQRDIGPTIQADGGDGFVATLKTDCATLSAVRIRSQAGVRTIPLAVDPRDRTIAPLMYMSDIDPRSPRRHGSRVSWVEGGVARSAAL